MIDSLTFNVCPKVFKPGARAPGFLELLLSANVCMRVCVFACVCVCVSAPEAINN